jgi:hypothetical protein
MNHTFIRQTAPAEVTIWVSHINEAASYNPAAHVPIDHIRYSEDRIKLAPHGTAQVATGFLVRQGGTDHVAYITGSVFGNEVWERVTVDLRAGDFTPPLDFSDPAPLEMGYVRGNTYRYPLVIQHGIDNWKVEICH